MRPLRLLVASCLLLLSPLAAAAQEPPYFVTYAHYLEEPGNLEIGLATTAGSPRGADPLYAAPWLELEYGVTGWWTSSLYVEGVTARHDAASFTGWRVENRFRPFRSEHRVNPVLYIEYENLNEATRIQKEIVGSGALGFEPISLLRQEHAHELEAKLILSSALGSWNLSENLIVEKNLSADEGFEFGYSIGVARSLGTLAGAASCRFCRQNVSVGVEAYGGLGSSAERSLDDTRHFIAPVLGWQVSDRSTLKVSVGFGLTRSSDRYLFRVGWAYELPLAGDGR